MRRPSAHFLTAPVRATNDIQVMWIAMVVLVATLAACSGGNPSTQTSPVTSVTLTIAFQPVTVIVSAAQQGTVAMHNVVLITSVAITNNTAAQIAITNPGCPYSEVILRLFEPSGAEGWHNYIEGRSCPPEGPTDTHVIAAGKTYVWHESDNLSNWVPLHLEAGVPFKLTADLLQWHQGDMSQLNTPTVPQGTHVTAQYAITFQ